MIGKIKVTKLENADEQIITNKEQIIEIIRNFYAKLYQNEGIDTRNITRVLNQESEEISNITKKKV